MRLLYTVYYVESAEVLAIALGVFVLLLAAAVILGVAAIKESVREKEIYERGYNDGLNDYRKSHYEEKLDADCKCKG